MSLLLRCESATQSLALLLLAEQAACSGVRGQSCSHAEEEIVRSEYYKSSFSKQAAGEAAWGPFERLEPGGNTGRAAAPGHTRKETQTQAGKSGISFSETCE